MAVSRLLKVGRWKVFWRKEWPRAPSNGHLMGNIGDFQHRDLTWFKGILFSDTSILQGCRWYSEMSRDLSNNLGHIGLHRNYKPLDYWVANFWINPGTAPGLDFWGWYSKIDIPSSKKSGRPIFQRHPQIDFRGAKLWEDSSDRWIGRWTLRTRASLSRSTTTRHVIGDHWCYHMISTYIYDHLCSFVHRLSMIILKIYP